MYIKLELSACALEMFTLCMNMTSKGESPRERQAHVYAHALAHAEKKLSKFVNEVIPFLATRSSSPRFRMESTKGKMNIHFETIANDQTCNADLRMPTVNTHLPIIHWKLTAQFEKIAIEEKHEATKSFCGILMLPQFVTTYLKTETPRKIRTTTQPRINSKHSIFEQMPKKNIKRHLKRPLGVVSLGRH
jgi:hypothetical protein